VAPSSCQQALGDAEGDFSLCGHDGGGTGTFEGLDFAEVGSPGNDRKLGVDSFAARITASGEPDAGEDEAVRLANPARSRISVWEASP